MGVGPFAEDEPPGHGRVLVCLRILLCKCERGRRRAGRLRADLLQHLDGRFCFVVRDRHSGELGDLDRAEFAATLHRFAELSHPGHTVEQKEQTRFRIGCGPKRIIERVAGGHRMNAKDARLPHDQFARRQVDCVPRSAGLRFAGLELFQKSLAGISHASSPHRFQQIERGGVIVAGTGPACRELWRRFLGPLDVGEVIRVVEFARFTARPGRTDIEKRATSDRIVGSACRHPIV